MFPCFKKQFLSIYQTLHCIYVVSSHKAGFLFHRQVHETCFSIERHKFYFWSQYIALVYTQRHLGWSIQDLFHISISSQIITGQNRLYGGVWYNGSMTYYHSLMIKYRVWRFCYLILISYLRKIIKPAKKMGGHRLNNKLLNVLLSTFNLQNTGLFEILLDFGLTQ